jgi:hypothetical protein
VAKIALAFIVLVLVVHGLIHLMGTAVYMRLAEIKGLSYKTTLLNGHWDLGEGGIRVFGALWVLPAIGFIAAAFALLAGWDWWQPVLLGTTLLSLALTGLDWSNAFMGAITDIAILAILWLGPQFAGSLS